MIDLLFSAIGAAVAVAVPLGGWVLKIQSRLAVAETKVDYMERTISGIESRVLQELRDVKSAIGELSRALHAKADRDG